MKAATPWLSISAAGLLAAFTGAVIAVWGPPPLPLQPLAVARPPSDGLVHVLVAVPAGTPTAPSPRGGPPVPVQLASLAGDSRVSRVSPVDSKTWRVEGRLSAQAVKDATRLPATDDAIAKVAATDDTYWPLLWGLENSGGTVGGFPAVEDADVDGPEANRHATGSGIVVAVVDSGIQADHPDLGRLWQNTREICGNGVDDDNDGYIDDCSGWDFLNHDNTPYDPSADNKHGTHVSGTIAAVPNNGRGVAGLAPGVTLMSLKITDGGSIYLSDAAEAIRYAADHGAKVVNASFGTNPGAPREAAKVLEDAIAYAGTKGVVVAAAAGNNGVDTDISPVWPADLPLDNIISVGASTADEKRASFSNYGASTVDVFAPGHYIVSTTDHGQYEALQGTSMATPHVAAAAALLLSQDGSLTPAQVRERIVATADRNSAYASQAVSGGRLNAAALVAPAAPAKVTVEAASFDSFAAGTEHTGTLTIRADPDLFTADSVVTWRGRLLTSASGSVYAVARHAVKINGDDYTTDDRGAALLGPAAGVKPSESTIDDEGVRVAVSTTLPAGQYALVVDIVGAADPRYGYGPPVAVFFAVAGPDGTPAPAPVGQTGPSAPPPSSVTPSPPPASGGGDGGSSPPAATQPTAGTTQPPTSPGGDTTPPTSGGTPPTSGGGGGSTPPTSEWTPPAGGGSTPPASGGGGWTPPTSGWTPPTSGWTPPTSGWTPPTSEWTPPASGGGGWTPPASGGGSLPSQPGPAPAPVASDGMTILAVSPNQGPATGGTILMIFGLNFPDNPVVSVGGTPAPVAAKSYLSLTVTAPSGVPGSLADVTVGDRSGKSVTMPGAYQYLGTSPPQPGTVPGAGQQPSGTTPGTQQPASGQPGVQQPSVGQPAPGPTPSVPGTDPTTPGASQPTSSPSASNPAFTGAVFRPDPEIGSVIALGGLTLAPITANNPVAGATPTLWANWACTRVTCEGFPM